MQHAASCLLPPVAPAVQVATILRTARSLFVQVPAVMEAAAVQKSLCCSSRGGITCSSAGAPSAADEVFDVGLQLDLPRALRKG